MQMYTIQDSDYRELMIGFLVSLEPSFEPAGYVIATELDEFGEVTFLTQGKVVIGYEINKIIKYELEHIDYSVIGAFGVTFKQRSAFIYQAKTDIHSFFIRR
jgi:hypothetical protein